MTIIKIKKAKTTNAVILAEVVEKRLKDWSGDDAKRRSRKAHDGHHGKIRGFYGLAAAG